MGTRLGGREDTWSWHVGCAEDPEVAEARRLHRRIYAARGFLPDPQLISDDGLLIDHWTSASHHVALSNDDVVVGHVRVIDRTAGALPAEVAFAHLELPQTCWEVSSLAIDPDRARTFETARRLYRQAFHHAEESGCTHWVALLEPSLLRILTQVFRLPMKRIGPEVPYPGAPVLPALISFADVHERMRTGETDPWFGRQLAAVQ